MVRMPLCSVMMGILTFKVMNMVAITYLSEMTSQLAAVACIPQIWAIPFLLWLRFTDTTTLSKWTVWAVMTIFLGNPYGKYPCYLPAVYVTRP